MGYEFAIEQELAEIGTAGKALKVVKWGDRAPKLDFRTWRQEGEALRPGKGLTLTYDEAKELAEALQKYLAERRAEA